MANKKRPSRAFAVYIGVLAVLLACAIALLIYALLHSGPVAPRLPGGSRFAHLMACLC